MDSKDVPFGSLVNQVLTNIEINDDRDQVIFTTSTGKQYAMIHQQSCCESVELEEIIGELDNLIGNPLLIAEEVTNNDDPPPKSDYEPESCTWTFYKLSTIKGSVTLRWYGESNGYYSESVSFLSM